MKKYRNWLLLAVVMAIVIAACGGGDGEEATTTAGETATTGGETATTGGETATTAGEAPAGDTGYENLDAALAGEYEGTTVDVWAQWLPESSEASNFTYTLEPFQEATGITVNFQPTPDYETALQVAVDGGNA
ncbi:MAG TPA: hypothetical protein VFU96_10110, partial [Acidimicrobiia bacterium]|nr:hypothetical protein [Acidimicrobiia bacterium]